MSQTSVIQVENISAKKGVNAKGNEWVRYALMDSDENWYSTFEKGVVLENMKGTTVEIEWEQNGDYRNLLRAAPAGAQEAVSQPPGEDRDWDTIGLRKTRCALWAAYLTEALPQAFGYWVSVQTDPPGTMDITNFIVRVGKTLVLSAEMDIFQRPPAGDDEDVPF